MPFVLRTSLVNMSNTLECAGVTVEAQVEAPVEAPVVACTYSSSNCINDDNFCAISDISADALGSASDEGEDATGLYDTSRASI